MAIIQFQVVPIKRFATYYVLSWLKKGETFIVKGQNNNRECFILSGFAKAICTVWMG